MARLSSAGSKVEEALLVRIFDHPPSPEAFTAHVEPASVPAVVTGAVKDWPAITKWNPSSGGLDYLEEQAGNIFLEVMHSKSAPVFYGDLRSHERVSLQFSAFISSCRLYLKHSKGKSGVFSGQDIAFPLHHLEDDCSSSLENSNQLYLAQVPIWNSENKERCPLETLGNDIQKPIFLKEKAISSINLWMNRAYSRSSTHYDPHNNLLCVVAGRKQVVLWPPSATPLLYPMPVYGEASNHSAVKLEHPDLSVHRLAKDSIEYSQKVILETGDTLFIPEGWFHQVDSDDLTIAVNFWWKSAIMCGMAEHMDAYYLRRIVNRLMEKEKNYMLLKWPIERLACTENMKAICKISDCHELASDVIHEDIKDNYENHGMIHQLDPNAATVLHELVSYVHETLDAYGQHAVPGSKFAMPPDNSSKIQIDSNGVDAASFLENDPIACIFSKVDPLVLRNVFLAMAHHFPRTLEGLVLHVLSPISAEVLTRKFDQMDQQTTKEQQCDFYQLFYSIFDNQYAVMDVILNRKEEFSFQAFRKVLDGYLGAILEETKG